MTRRADDVVRRAAAQTADEALLTVEDDLRRLQGDVTRAVDELLGRLQRARGLVQVLEDTAPAGRQS